MREIRMSPAAGDLWAAIDAALGTLLELAELHPAKRGNSGALIARSSP